jgi:hypothetical protein
MMGGEMSFSAIRDMQTQLNFAALGFKEGPQFSPFPAGGSWR